VVLPRNAVAIADFGAPIAPLGALAVLVVDDDPGDREWLAESLRRAGYSVETAANGGEAIARCEARKFAAVTLDLMLPDMTGRDVLAAIRGGKLNGDVPVIIVTVCDASGAPRGLQYNRALQKPIPEDALVDALRGAGVAPDLTPVHIVDADPVAAGRARDALEPHGYRTRIDANTGAAMRAATHESGTHPAVLVLRRTAES
jgi:CheY-like chemotaxis protein